MKKKTIFIGLYVHKNSIDIAFANDARGGDIRCYGGIDGEIGTCRAIKNQAKAPQPNVCRSGPCQHKSPEGRFSPLRARLTG